MKHLLYHQSIELRRLVKTSLCKQRRAKRLAQSRADSDGNVYTVWHAGAFEGESSRGLYLRKLIDGGVTFGAETKINDNGKGVCGCCTLSAVTGNDGTLYVSYRTAGEGVHRDMTLLTSSDGEKVFPRT